jgi:hypothetical protein
MERYTQLAVDNIRRDPTALAIASLRRVFRMFLILGSDDRFRSAQFTGSRAIYTAATVLSTAYALLFLAGVVISWQRGYPCAIWLVAVLYIPATIFMLLPNMRYMVTAQPFLLIFVAIALASMADRLVAPQPISMLSSSDK